MLHNRHELEGKIGTIVSFLSSVIASVGEGNLLWMKMKRYLVKDLNGKRSHFLILGTEKVS